MNELNRRSFLHKSLFGAGVLASLPALASEPGTSVSRCVADRVDLGNGIRASRLAMGTGMRGSNRESDHTRLGQKKFTQLVRHGFEEGLNFFDMADLYGSHPFLKNALEGIPREQYVLLTKIWFRKNQVIHPSGGAKEEIDRFRRELGTDVIDICLIHCVTDVNWLEDLKRVREEMSEMKEKGAVRAIGCSFHDHAAMKAMVEQEWGDVILARINHAGNKMDGTPADITATLKKARAKGKTVIGMKIFGEGTLIKPAEKDASIQYVLRNDLIDAMTIGMLCTAEVDDSMTRINQALKS
ncbi:MAG: aldo/keto reductase [Candidatus Omnitrophota bacterium]|jgi:predicted aldo/keto reductase-like oxidoreductase|nr:MAG: aldo/keto reductase [Candidatus Omnitrophota bacterium]